MTDTSNITSVARSFHALSDPIRLHVISLLGFQSHSVRELSGYLGITQSHLNWHLKTLTETGIIVESRRGRERFYTLDRNAFRPPFNLLFYYATGREPGRQSR